MYSMTLINPDLPGVTVENVSAAEMEAIRLTFGVAGFDSFNIKDGTVYRGPVVRGKPSPIAIILDEPDPPMVRCADCRRVARTNDPLHEVEMGSFAIFLCGDCCAKHRRLIIRTITPNAIRV